MSEKEDKRKSKKDDDELKKKQLEHLKEGGRKNSAGSESEVDTNKLNEEIGTESFKIVSLLGVGSQGRVYLVQLNDTKNFYAMKVFKKEKIINNEKVISSFLETLIKLHIIIIILYWSITKYSYYLLKPDYTFYLNGTSLFSNKSTPFHHTITILFS